jgi:hypothetical protein
MDMKFRVILAGQWRWSRIVIILGTVIGFALPILSVQGATNDDRGLRPIELLLWLQGWGILYPLLAAGLGLLVAMASWAPDHRGRHVHTLSLPIERWRFLLYRFAAGVTLLLIPIAALLLGALLASKGAQIPPGLRTYPISLGLRFALATLVAFAVFFAISGGTPRTAGIILGTIGTLVAIGILGTAMGFEIPMLDYFGIALFNSPGPLALFAARWMLIDV